MGSPEVAPRNWDEWRHGAARLRSPRFARASVVRVWMHLAGVIFLLGAGTTRVSPGKALRRTSRVFLLARAGPAKTRSQRETERPPTRPFGCGSQRPSHSDSSHQTPWLGETCGMSNPAPSQRGASSFLEVSQLPEEGVILAGRTADGKTSFGPLGFHRRGRLVLAPASSRTRPALRARSPRR